jgi:hypothetical protein
MMVVQVNYHFILKEKLVLGLLYPEGTLNEKFGIYMRQRTIFKAVLNNYPTYFLSPYYYLVF